MDLVLPVFENIWLADDDIDDCGLFEDVVKQIIPTVSITTIPNGEVLMEMIVRSKKPDILFLDLNMPCKDGFDCLMEIRAKRRFSRLPIVVFSSSRETKHIDASYGYGASLYYSKPTSFTELISGMSNLFKMNWNDPYTITSNHYVNNKFIAYNCLNEENPAL